MKIAYNDPNPGVFFAFDVKHPDEGITVRPLNDSQIKIISKETEKYETEVIDGKWVERTQTNDEKRADLVYDYCIVGWSGLTDEDGKPIECTRETKLKLMRENPNFALFVNQAIAAAGSKLALNKETELKNLLTS